MDKIGITRKDKDLEKWDVLIKSEHELNELIRRMEPEAETTLLVGLMLDNETIPKVITILRYNHFREQRHLLLYNAIIQLWLGNHNVDMSSVMERLSEEGNIDLVGGPGCLAYLVSKTCPSPSRVILCAKLLKAETEYRENIKESCFI